MLQQMQALAALSDSRNQQRQQLAETSLTRGLALLQQAHDEGFEMPLRLQEAAAALIEAIKFNRADVRGPLGMAYVFLLLEDHLMAQKYLSLAREIEAQHPLLQAFEQKLLADQQRIALRGRRPAQTGSVDGGLARMDFDAQFDATASRLRQLLREVMTAAGLPPLGQPRELSAWRQQLQQQQKSCDTLLLELTTLEQEIDCSELRRLMQPIEAHLRRGEQAYADAQRGLQLQQKIRAETELVSTVSAETQQTQDADDLPVLEENLEAFLDNADGYLRQIEGFEARGLDAERVREALRQLQDRIENYQDLLEETHARLEA